MILKNYLKFFLNLALYLSISCLSGHSQQNQDGSYSNIAILAWGSLVNSPRELEFNGLFKKTSLAFPIELSCVSFVDTKNQKLTRIIDKHWGHPLTLWLTKSTKHLLSEAIQNLAHREYTTKDNIFYMRTISPNEKIKDNEIFIVKKNKPLKYQNQKLWCIANSAAQQLPKNKIIELADWASREKFDAVIWTGLGETKGYDRQKLIQLLKSDANTLNNTKKYILNSPDLKELTQFEKNILAGDLD